MTATQSFLHGFTVAMWFATAAVAVGLLVAAVLARAGGRPAVPIGAISPAGPARHPPRPERQPLPPSRAGQRDSSPEDRLARQGGLS